MNLPGGFGCLFDLEGIPGKEWPQSIDGLVKVTLPLVNINIRLKDRRAFRDSYSDHIGQTNGLGAVVNLLLHATNRRYKDIVTPAYQRNHMSAENLHREAGVGGEPGAA